MIFNPLTRNAGGGSGWQEYSLEEQRIGTWIDGRPIYRRVLSGIKSPAANGAAVTDTDLSFIAAVVSVQAILVGVSGGIGYLIPSNAAALDIIHGNLIMYLSDATLANKDMTVILQYTKKTDQPDPAKVQQIEAMRLSATVASTSEEEGMLEMPSEATNDTLIE